MNKAIVCLFWVMVSSIAVHAQVSPVIVLSRTDTAAMLGRQVVYFEDSSNLLTVEDADSLYRLGKFHSHTKNVFTAPSRTQAVWFRLVVQNKTGKEIWLDAGTMYSAWYIDFYSSDSSGRYRQPLRTGVMRGPESRQYPVNNYWLKLADGTDAAVKVFYIRMLSGRTPEYLFQAGTLTALHQLKSVNDYLTAGFVGLMVVMILYNFFLFVATRDGLYFIYISYLSTALFSFSYFYGYPLFPESKWFWEYNFVWYAPGYVLVSWFSIRYLHLERYRLLYYAIIVLTFCLAVVLPVLNGIGIPVKSLIPFNQPVLLLYSFVFLFAGFYLYVVRKERVARYYFLGWSAEAIGMIISILVLRGDIPSTVFTRSILYTGISIEMIMFSFALADRVALLRKENLQLAEKQNNLLEAKVAERTRQLEQQSSSLKQVNDTKDKLFAIIGHDLRGPVGGLRSILDMYTGGLLDKETFLASAPRLRDNVQHVYATLENLLQWSQAQMNGLKTFPAHVMLPDAVKEVTALFGDTLSQKMLTMHTDIQPGETAFCDPEHLRLVLRNLIANAIKFTQSGGAIRISAKKEGKLVMICVADNGIGMDALQVAGAFKLSSGFTTTGTQGEKGTGLGLLLCRELVEKNNGTISVESEINRGTRFFVRFPASA